VERWRFAASWLGVLAREEGSREMEMNRRDEELLDKQLRSIEPPRNDAVLGFVGVAVFVAGLTIGAYLTVPAGDSRAPHDAMAAISTLATVQR
jgi:hypothetical protein